MRYPDQYLQFIQKFNQGEFYECHDLLEELWMEDKANKFLQGLLQLAVGLYHLECGNIKGARWMFGNARKYLSTYSPIYWDMDVDRVLVYIDACVDALPEVDSIPYTEAKSLSVPSLRLSLLQE
jgi:predicted metal-dependent hydrolase